MIAHRSRSREAIANMKQISIRGGVVAVSYTHLDVYKRQGLRVVTVVGGVPYKGQLSKLSRGVDILVATPGRLHDLMERGDVKLRDVEILVLDEADRMLDMGCLLYTSRCV